jgi:hypothetical protein
MQQTLMYKIIQLSSVMSNVIQRLGAFLELTKSAHARGKNAKLYLLAQLLDGRHCGLMTKAREAGFFKRWGFL